MSQLLEIFNQIIGQVADPVQLKQAIDAVRTLMNTPGIAVDNIATDAVDSAQIKADAVTDVKIGNRSVVPANPIVDSEKLGVLLNNLAYMLMALSGASTWRTVPTATINAINTLLGSHRVSSPADHVAGSIGDTAIGPRVIAEVAPSVDTNTLSVLLNNLAYMIAAITGKADWKIAPATTLELAKTHIDAAAPHSGHETPTGAQGKVDTHRTSVIIDHPDNSITDVKIAPVTISEGKLVVGTLDNRYFTESEMLNGEMDVRYFTESEVNIKINDIVNYVLSGTLPVGVTDIVYDNGEIVIGDASIVTI